MVSRVTEPGLRLKLPFLDSFSPIQVTLQADKVTDIPCGTKGVMVYFDKVEVWRCQIPAHWHNGTVTQ